MCKFTSHESRNQERRKETIWIGLDTNNPNNRLKIYPDNPAKSSINLHFLFKNLKNLSKNLKKSRDSHKKHISKC